MATNRNQRDRERARQQARAAQQQQQFEAAAARRRRMIVAIVAAVLLLAVVAGVFGARSNDTTSASTTIAPASSTTSSPPVTGLGNLPAVQPGEQMTTPTTCPADDGSSPRVTTFAGPPPTCIDPKMFYEAVISTTKGDLTMQLDPEQAPNAVNNFVVLSRYHYYDGQPFTTIISRQSASVEALFDNPAGVSSPGYTLASEVPPQGQIFVPGSIAMIPEPGAPDDGYGGAFLLATFELAPGIPQSVTQFGIMLDGQDVLKALEKASSQSGSPTEVITITSIRTRPTIPID
jgi:cyclophilin family peptidyl-prolyl cis-trans isomerase